MRHCGPGAGQSPVSRSDDARRDVNRSAMTAMRAPAQDYERQRGYDGMYVALAEALGLPLLTDDDKFATAPGHHAEIHHYPD
jgi:predicted nucleic acid-binding protein